METHEPYDCPACEDGELLTHGHGCNACGRGATASEEDPCIHEDSTGCECRDCQGKSNSPCPEAGERKRLRDGMLSKVRKAAASWRRSAHAARHVANCHAEKYGKGNDVYLENMMMAQTLESCALNIEIRFGLRDGPKAVSTLDDQIAIALKLP